MKKVCFLLIFLAMVIALVDLSSDKVIKSSTNNTPVASAKEAEKVVGIWAEDHKLTNKVMKVDKTDPIDNEISMDGKTYYIVDVHGIYHAGPVRILVDKQTGSLFHFGSDLKSMDTWYKEYLDQQANVIANKNMEKRRMQTLDKRLIGKWRSVEFDGTSPTVEFFANGTVSNNTKLWPRGTQKFATDDGIITLENGQRFEYKTDGSGRAAINDANGNTLLLMKTKL